MKDYLSFKGREIYLPIEQSTMDRNIYFKTTGDGKLLQITKQKTLIIKCLICDISYNVAVIMLLALTIQWRKQKAMLNQT